MKKKVPSKPYIDRSRVYGGPGRRSRVLIEKSVLWVGTKDNQELSSHLQWLDQTELPVTFSYDVQSLTGVCLSVHDRHPSGASLSLGPHDSSMVIRNGFPPVEDGTLIRY